MSAKKEVPEGLEHLPENIIQNVKKLFDRENAYSTYKTGESLGDFNKLIKVMACYEETDRPYQLNYRLIASWGKGSISLISFSLTQYPSHCGIWICHNFGGMLDWEPSIYLMRSLVSLHDGEGPVYIGCGKIEFVDKLRDGEFSNYGILNAFLHSADLETVTREKFFNRNSDNECERVTLLIKEGNQTIIDWFK